MTKLKTPLRVRQFRIHDGSAMDGEFDIDDADGNLVASVTGKANALALVARANMFEELVGALNRQGCTQPDDINELLARAKEIM